MKVLITTVILLNSLSLFAQNAASSTSKPNAKATTVSPQKKGNDNKNGLKDTITVMEKDTSKETQEPQYFYLAGNINVFVNTRGGFNKRLSPSLEVGRTYGIFDIGIATGQLNSISRGSDTTRFIEFRPTINIFSKGRFSESLCLAAGYVFNAKQELMTEVCNGINFNISEIWTVSVLQGYYFFDGTNSSRSTQFVGVNVTYNFLKKHGVNIYRKRKAILNDN